MSDDDKMPDLSSLMNVAKKLQGDVVEMQQNIERMQCEASSGGGMVTAVVNGRYELVALKIDREVVDPNEVEMLQDLVVAAVTQAMARMRDLAKAEMAKLTGGLNIPGMPTL
jgi:DNA-binding YbaB/EbfC family protein